MLFLPSLDKTPQTLLANIDALYSVIILNPLKLLLTQIEFNNGRKSICPSSVVKLTPSNFINIK